MTVDVQPDPKRYLLQDWIINFADGTPTYYEGWTKAKSSDWHKFRAVDQEWERTHYQRQSTIVGMLSNVIENGRRSGAPKRFDKAWVKVLQDHLGAYKHAEFGLGTSIDAGAALWLHPDDQQRHPDELLLQAALRPGPDTVSGRNRARHRRLRPRCRQETLAGRSDLAGHTPRRSRLSWAARTSWSSISPSMSYSSPWWENCSAAASSCRWPPRRTTI